MLGLESKTLEPALMLTNCHFIPLSYLWGIVNSNKKDAIA